MYFGILLTSKQLSNCKQSKNMTLKPQINEPTLSLRIQQQA